MKKEACKNLLKKLFSKKKIFNKNFQRLFLVKKSLEEKIEEKTSKSIPQPNQQEKISKLTSENTRLKKLFEKF